eukprot:7440925-Pyramimonas_sp.AAC.1
MLRTCPKRAHRYLFESAENHKLDGVRLSTGEVSTEPEDVIQAVVAVSYTHLTLPTILLV